MRKKIGFYRKNRIHVIILLGFLFTGLLVFCSRPCFAVRVDDASGGPTIPLPEELLSMEKLQAEPGKVILALAEARLKQGLWLDALSYARGLISLEPGNMEAHGILGTIYAFTGRKSLAQKELGILKKDKTPGFFPELIMAMLAAQEMKYEEAGKHLYDALKVRPKHPLVIYYAGSLDLAQGRTDDAGKAFKAALASNPGFTPAIAGLGQVNLRQKKMKEAEGYFLKAVDREPGNPIYRRQLLDIYKTTGRKEAADRQMKEMLYFMPGVKQNYLRRGMQLLAKGSYREAINLMDSISGIYKNIPEAFYIKAAARTNLKETKAALEDLRSFISQHWAFPRAHHYAGMCYLALDRMGQAEKQFRAVIAINPKMGRSYVPLTIIEQLGGNFDRALEGLRLAKSGGEPPSLVHYLSAHVLLAKGDNIGFLKEMQGAVGFIPGLVKKGGFFLPETKDARLFADRRNLMVLYFLNAWYGKTIEMSDLLTKSISKDRFAWYFKAVSESVQKKKDNAIHAFNQLLLTDPNLLAAHIGLGQLYLRSRDFKKAVSHFEKVTEIDPAYGSGYVALGDALLQAKSEGRAIKSYEKAMKLNPEAPLPFMKLALIFSEKKEKLDEALKLAKKAEALAKESPYTMDVLGWVHVKRGELKEAIPKLKEAARRLPRNPVVKYHLGVAHYKNNDMKEAERALRTAIRVSRGFPGSDQAKEILKKISR